MARHRGVFKPGEITPYELSSFVDIETRDAGELDPSDLLYVETGRTPDKVLNSRPTKFVWCYFTWFEYASMSSHYFPYCYFT